MGMTNLWATENILIEKLQREGKVIVDASVFDFSYNKNGDINFDFSNYSSERGMVTERVKTNLLWGTTDLDDFWLIEKWKSLRETRDQLLQTYVGKTVEGAALMALGAVAPELAIIGSLGGMVISGTLKSVSGLDSLASSQSGKMTIKGSSMAIQNAVDYMNATASFEASLTKENFEDKMRWFGMGGTYTFNGKMLGEESGLSIAGIYKPEIIRQIAVWEADGIAGWMGWDKDMVEGIMKKINGAEFELSSNEKAACEALLTGGYDIVNEEDMGYFVNRITDIQEGYKNLSDGENTISIHNAWRTLVEPEKVGNDDK